MFMKNSTSAALTVSPSDHFQFFSDTVTVVLPFENVGVSPIESDVFNLNAVPTPYQ